LRPLNEIFGTEANVRLVRELSLRSTSLTAGELAKHAMLSRTSIYPALRELERTGVVEFIGAGARRLVQLRKQYPLSRNLRELFRAEARRFDAITIALRELLSALPRAPISAWVDPGENLQSTDTLTLYLVARPEELDTLTDYLNDRLTDVERKYDIHIAVHGLTRSELETLDRTPLVTRNSVVLLGGVPPVALLERSRPAANTSTLVSHDEHDARSRRLALAIAAKIRRDPGLIAIAEDRAKRRARESGPRERRELTEWIRILSTMSPARLQRFLLEDTERAVRLRQTLPALNLLSPIERDAVIRSQTDAEVIAAIRHR
jgi:DNA-binding transcriptional ArsR family regulator